MFAGSLLQAPEAECFGQGAWNEVERDAPASPPLVFSRSAPVKGRCRGRTAYRIRHADPA